jgi:hypothetical protein
MSASQRSSIIIFKNLVKRYKDRHYQYEIQNGQKILTKSVYTNIDIECGR